MSSYIQGHSKTSLLSEALTTIKLPSASWLLYASIVLLLLLTCLPITQLLPSGLRQLLQVIAVAVFVLGLFQYGKLALLTEYFICVLFFSFYVCSVWGLSQNLGTCMFNVLCCLTFAFYGIYTIESKAEDRSYAKRLLRIALVLFTVTAFTTIIGLQENPLAVRELGRSGSGYSTSGDAFLALKDEYRRENIASWSMVYGMVLMCPVLILLYRFKRRIGYLALFAVCEICILLSQLTFGVALSLLGVLAAVLLPQDRGLTGKPIIVAATALLLIALILPVFLPALAQAANAIGLETLGEKLQDLMLYMNGTVAGDVSARFDRYSSSFEVFLEHPVFGASVVSGFDYSVFGNHSDFFDMLGFYGVFGIAVMIGLAFRYFQRINKAFDSIAWGFALLYAILIILFVVNPVWYSPQVLVGGVMLPSIVYSLNHRL